jgi:hypothetical protein
VNVNQSGLFDVDVHVEGVDVLAANASQLADLRHLGRDHGGNPVEIFVDGEGGWPLRCCLQDSMVGERLAIVAWSPFPWSGPYAEIGPVVIHASDCGGRTSTSLPVQFLSRPQLLRPYGYDRRIGYDDVVIVDGDDSLPDVLVDLLARGHVDFVLARNVRAGCYSFTAVRREDAKSASRGTS